MYVDRRPYGTMPRITTFSTLAYSKGGEHRMYYKIGRYALSVVASQWTYCTPRVSARDPSVYTHVEVALILDGNLTAPSAGFPCSEMWEPGHHPVAGYVPVERIDDMLRALRSLSRLA